MLIKRVVGLLILTSAWGWLVASAQDSNAIPPYKRVLNPAQAKQVAELEKAINRLVAAAKPAEACQPAEEVLALRTEAQGREHWETVNARIQLEVVRAVSKQPAAEQKAFAGLGQLKKQTDALVNRGLYSQAQPLLEQILAIRRQVLGELHRDTAQGYNNVAFTLNGQASVAITVESLAQEATNLRAMVSALKTAGVLNREQAHSLIVTLSLNGNNGDIDKVQAFLNEVQAYLGAGILTQAQADPLLYWGNILLLGVIRR
jgi:hypothetical protein